jgi:nucleotide-binding universal stress UspA family protein
MHVIREPDVGSKSSIGRLISKSAVDMDAAAIVVASHSTKGLREALLGSVTNWLIHNCER